MATPARSTNVSPEGRAQKTVGRFRWLVSVAVVIAVAVVVLVAWKLGLLNLGHAGRLAHSLRSLHDPPLAAIVFVGVWAVLGSLGFPALPLMIAGGLLFGTLLGTALNLAGTALGASGGYGIARVLLPEPVRRWLAGRLRGVDVSNRAGFLAMARFRLLPIVPLAVGNFAAGLAGMRFWPYLGGTLIGQLPSTLIYTYFAAILVRAASSGAKAAATRDVVLATVLLLVISLVPWLVARVGRNHG